MVLRMIQELHLHLKASCLRLLRQKMLCGALLAVMLLFSLHITSSLVTLRRVSSTPAWVQEREAGSCSPRTNVAFLKSHKCASSTIQNILFRYGLAHGLHFGLPDAGNYFGGGLRPFNADMLRLSPWSKLGVNIMAVHMKWDHQQVASVMPNDTVYISIVREPMELFESLYTYAKMEKFYGLPVEEFAANVPTDTPRYNGYLGYNQMVWDFGIENETLANNLTAVRELVRKAEAEFDLVLVAERMEESLVLLSHLLCWNLRDVIALRFNARTSKFKNKLSSETQKVLRQKLAPDYLLYERFVRKFDDLVEDFGRQRMDREVSRLNALTKQLMKTCGFMKQDAAMMFGAEKPWSDMVEGYTATAGNSKCQHYSRSEVSFIKFLRAMQRMEVSRRFGVPDVPGLDAIPLGASIFEGTANMDERIKTLKKMLVHTERKQR
ncbi:galactose-3-O-sulfotransferase 2 [Procambarus clarkii]|uniref:galactose-3-O-sulfotransferase 2 n=1 Tax=Procambarus clarkii TaxID=6728 RepID=UPI0037435F0C